MITKLSWKDVSIKIEPIELEVSFDSADPLPTLEQVRADVEAFVASRAHFETLCSLWLCRHWDAWISKVEEGMGIR